MSVLLLLRLLIVHDSDENVNGRASEAVIVDWHRRSIRTLSIILPTIASSQHNERFESLNGSKMQEAKMYTLTSMKIESEFVVHRMHTSC